MSGINLAFKFRQRLSQNLSAARIAAFEYRSPERVFGKAGAHFLHEGVGFRYFQWFLTACPFQRINQTGQPPVDPVLAPRRHRQTLAIGFELAYFFEFGAHPLHVVGIKAFSLSGLAVITTHTRVV